MFDYLYEWIQNLAFYLVLVTAVLNAVPDKEYRKYIRFFTGLVLILMLAAPVLELFGTDFQIEKLEKLYEEAASGAGRQTEEPYDGAWDYGRYEDVCGEESGKGKIEVEEIRID